MRTTLISTLLLTQAVLAIAAPKVKGQSSRPYMGYVYPAGGRQGATFAVATPYFCIV